MNRYVKMALTAAAAAVIILAPHAALAIDPPHNQVSCSYCHVTHRDQGALQPSNVCISCHAAGQSAASSPFSLHDMANPFGTFTSTLSGGKKRTQSSHNWSAPDNFPKAGALPPTNSSMNSIAMLRGTVTCARCHEIHASKTDPTRGPKLLRMKNDNDAMCLDCHRMRNTLDHMKGSHPVNFNYTSSSKVRANPAAFNIPPLTDNPANSTAQLKLQNGKLLCTTCHGVHFTDSSSGTFDNRSSAVLGRLSTSTGSLLRVSMKGSSADGTNICTACHVKENHSNGGQNIQCADCHGGHVDNETDSVNKTPNVWLIKRFFDYSSAKGSARNKPVFYTSTSSSKRKYANDTNTGVCQVCHKLPATVDQHVQPEELAKGDAGCKVCHTHQGGTFKPVSAAVCGDCHGRPPYLNVAGNIKTDPPGTKGGYAVYSSVSYANDPLKKDESKTPHLRHSSRFFDDTDTANYAQDCNECHKGYSHKTGTFRDVFVSGSFTPGASSMKAVKFGTVAPSYTTSSTTDGTCSSVYCHSNGAPRNSSLTATVPVYATPPAWGTGKGKISAAAGNKCTACHQGQPTTNAHTAHLGKGYKCQNCHALTMLNYTSINIVGGKHVDGNKDIQFETGTLGFGTSWSQAGATCGTSKCHSNGANGTPVQTPKWVDATTGKCGTCHYTTPTIAATSAQTISSNRHFTHFSSSYGPKAVLGKTVTSCQTCHDYSSTQPDIKHVDGTIHSLTAVGSNCAKCHPGTLPSWTSGTRLACESCHLNGQAQLPGGVLAPLKTSFASTGHGQYANSNQCINCHNASKPHIDGLLGTAEKRLTLANDNTLCTSCHNDSAKVGGRALNMNTHVTEKGGAPNSPCKACHDVHGTTNIFMIKTTINGSTVTFTNISSGFVQLTPPYKGLCQVCHTLTSHYRSGVDPSSDSHSKKFCLSCHDHKDTAYAFKYQGSGSCDGCHGYPPAPAGFTGSTGNYANARTQDYIGGGGAHTVAGHISPSATASQGMANCGKCHSGGSFHTMATPVTPSKVTIGVDDAYRFDATQPITYDGTLVDGANATGSCSNVSCHFQKTPKWSTER